MPRVEEPTKLRIDRNNIDITPRHIPHHRPRKLARRRILLRINAQAPINPQLQHDLILSHLLRRARPLHALSLQPLQLLPQAPNLTTQSLALDLELGRLLRDAELGRVEAQDLLRVLCGVVGLEVVVVGAGGVVELALQRGEGLCVCVQA